MSTPAVAPATTQSFYEMDDAAFRAALRHIVTTSHGEEEVQERLKSELNYPYSIAITSNQPTDGPGLEARKHVVDLGGCTLANGAMVMVMAHGPSGATIYI